MKKLMIASLVAMMLSGAALADCGKCQQGAQAQKSCCQSQSANKAGWFSSGSAACAGAACPGKQANNAQQQCQSCKEKAQGQAPSGGSSEAKEGSCCQQKK